MSLSVWILLGLALWVVLGTVVAVFVGRMIRRRDAQVPHDVAGGVDEPPPGSRDATGHRSLEERGRAGPPSAPLD